MIHVTQLAVQRFQEQIDNLPDDAVRAILSTPAFDKAAEFGAKRVILAHGHRAILEGGSVITVIAARRRRHRSVRLAVNTTWIDETP